MLLERLLHKGSGQREIKDHIFRNQCHKSYQAYLIQFLKDPAEAAAFLDAVLEDGDF